MPTTPRTPPAFHVMTKPIGALCNLNCEYCFYLSKQSLYAGERFRMSDEVLESYLCQLIEAHRTPEVTVAWQGGEPTLMGIDFYRRALDRGAITQAWQTIQNKIQPITLLTTSVRLPRETPSSSAFAVTARRRCTTPTARRAGASRPPTAAPGIRLLQKHGSIQLPHHVNAANAEHPLEGVPYLRDERAESSAHPRRAPRAALRSASARSRPRSGSF